MLLWGRRLWIAAIVPLWYAALVTSGLDWIGVGRTAGLIVFGVLLVLLVIGGYDDARDAEPWVLPSRQRALQLGGWALSAAALLLILAFAPHLVAWILLVLVVALVIAVIGRRDAA